jgi:DNA-binding NtrC family response regulator
VLLDIKMPEMDGLAALRAFRERGYDMPVLMISGHGDVGTAVEAAKRGAYDFFEKPLQRERVLLSLRNAIEACAAAARKSALRHQPDDLIGDSPAMRKLRETIERAAPTPATVLVTGESGTGKELVARALHLAASGGTSPHPGQLRGDPDELIESELFGHEKGSFTGAVRKADGKFVAADGGTIFLDEIGDMSRARRPRCCACCRAARSSRSAPSDVRASTCGCIAATHRDLEARSRPAVSARISTSAST